MIKVVGNKGCSRCEMVKNILSNKNVEYEYILFLDLDKKEQEELMEKSKSIGQLSFPIIMKGENIIDIKEII